MAAAWIQTRDKGAESVIILAGGRSQRLGHDKVWEKIGEHSLFAKVIASVIPLGSKVIVVTAAGNAHLPAVEHDLQIVSDLKPGRGPLCGIYTVLRTSSSRHNLVVAADMPFLNRGLLYYMIGLTTDVDLVVPRVEDRVEPLHAVYSKSCLEPIERMLDEGELSVYKLFPRVKVRYVEADEIARFDPRMLSFFNVNTEEDMKRAREISGGDTIDD